MPARKFNARPATSGRYLLLSLALTALSVACGVPIAALELTPTPSGQTIDVLPVSRSVAVAASTVIAATPPPAAAGTAPAALTPASTRVVPTPTPAPAATSQPGRVTSSPAPGPTGTATATLGSGANPGGVSADSAIGAPPPASGNFAADALTYLNSYRTGHGLAALRSNASLTAAAGAYAKLMADKSWFTCGCDPHRGPDGSSPESRIRAAGYQYSAYGEALAAGQSSGAGAVNAWLASPAHAAIALSATATDVGLGYAYNAADPYRHYWVLATGTP